MTNNTQIRTKRISFILALLVIAYVAVDTYLFTYHKINTTTITTPVIIGLVVTILLCGLLQRFFYTWLTKNPIDFYFGWQSPIILDSDFEIKDDCANEAQTIEQSNKPVIDSYDTLLENIKKKEAERQVEVMNAIREYVTIKTAPYLSKEAIVILISKKCFIKCFVLIILK